MENTNIQKFYPTSEELSSVCSVVKCSQDNCKALFRSTSNLTMHLIKHHKLNNNGLTSKKTETQYFCPCFDCPYYKNSKKHFTKLKYLKQHFLKVHALKEFICEKCGKKFSTETFRALHLKNCGKVFSCKCGSSYNSSEAILTHIKRKGKGHFLLKKDIEGVKSLINMKNESDESIKKERFIYPKLTNDMTFPVHYIAAVALSELCVPQNFSVSIDKGIQTEDFDLNKEQTKKQKNSQETQTTAGRSRKLKFSIQTQTNNDYLKRKGKAQLKNICKKRKKSMETQTKDYYNYDNEDMVYSKKLSNNNDKPNVKLVYPKNSLATEEEKARKWLWEMVSANKTSDSDSMQYGSVLSKNNQTQFDSKRDAQVFDLNKLCNIETQTDLDSFLNECNEDTAFTLCSTTETQTTEDFDSLLYSNMCTQTCEEVDELFNFNFVHNETQTAWPDLDDCHQLDT